MLKILHCGQAYPKTGKVGKTIEVLETNKEKMGSALVCRCIDVSWAPLAWDATCNFWQTCTVLQIIRAHINHMIYK
jgi:hypothetical protein